jgi:hypothetical protein
MKKFIYFYLTLTLFFLNFNFAFAGILNGFNDPPGCGGDAFLPVLNICGRNKQVAGAACERFTQECNLGHLVQTGERALVWIISIALLIIPLYIMYIGVMMIWNQKFDQNVGNLKKYREKLYSTIIYFVLMLAAWLIVRLVVDIFQVDPRINTFLLDDNGGQIKARSFNVD